MCHVGVQTSGRGQKAIVAFEPELRPRMIEGELAELSQHGLSSLTRHDAFGRTERRVDRLDHQRAHAHDAQPK
jgi:hypothetical protein